MRKAYSYIRMSTETQLKGDSLRRQLLASKEYAEQNDLEIVDNINGQPLRDLGVSAFEGKNNKIGAFALFISELENGKIEPNSVLLVESLDRLSREKVSVALAQFISIINQGIEIVTLIDKHVYNKSLIDNNTGALFISLAVMVRANEESETKSKRLRACWSNKRKIADVKPLTKLGPAWLKYSAENERFEIIPERVKIVELIFDMCINSGGLFAIARHLNENNVPVFGGGKIWYRSYIGKIINNRSVLGEFQPHTVKEAKRQKTGDPILDYFPIVVSEQQFLLAKIAVSRRTANGKGRKGLSFSSLFSGLVYCGNCNFAMLLRNRGGSEKSSKCLVCVNQLSRAGCKSREWNLADLDSIIFPHLKEINFDDLISENSKPPKISHEDNIEVLKVKLDSKEKEIDNNLSLAANHSGAVRARISVKIEVLQSAIDQIKIDIDVAHRALSEDAFLNDVGSSQKLKELIDKLQLNKDDYIFRSSVNQMLTRLIRRIKLIESNESFVPWEIVEQSPELIGFRKTAIARKTRNIENIVNTKEFEKFYKNYNRKISIFYKSGATRHILWGDNISFGK